MRNEPLYRVIGYSEPNNERLVLAENLSHKEAWQTARKAMDENLAIYAISVRPMIRDVKGGNNE